MRMMRLRAAWLACLCVGLPLPAAAVITCNLSPTPLAFGSVDTLRGPTVSSTATIDVTCTTSGAVAAAVSLNLSTLATGAAVRRMGDPAGPRYQIFADSARTQPWGDGSGGTVALSAAGTVLPGVVFRQRFTVYGRVLAPQTDLRAGAYFDTLTVILNY